MTKKFLVFILFVVNFIKVQGQTATRNDAGLRGDAGAVSGFFETSAPVNYPSFATSWWHLLDVRHTNTSNNMAMQFSGSFFDQHLYFRKTSDNAAQPWSKVLLETDGKVGIGTTNPHRTLEVYNNSGAAKANSYLRISSGTAGAYGGNSHLEATYNDYGNVGLDMKTARITMAAEVATTTDVGGSISFLTKPLGGNVNDEPTEKVRISSNGNVGIGTTSPTHALTINGDAKLLGNTPAYLLNYASLSETIGGASTVIGNNIRSGLGSNTVKRTVNQYDPGSFIALNYAQGITFNTGIESALNTEVSMYDNERMRITQSGNVGIGTASPDSKLTVRGENATVDIQSTANGQTPGLFLRYQNSSSGGSKIYYNTNNAITYFDNLYANTPASTYGSFNFRTVNTAASLESRLYINGQNGNIGLGTINPSEKLTIYGVDNVVPAIMSLECNRQDAGNVEVGSIRGKNNEQEVARVSFSRGGGSHTGYLSFYTKETNVSSLAEAVRINPNGAMGIGTTNPTEKLTVNGKIKAREIRVDPGSWADDVFEEDYKLNSLTEIEAYIKKHKHLPEIPTAKQVAENGVELGEMNKLLLKKVEELTLHLIQKGKELTNEKEKNKLLDERVNRVEEWIKNSSKKQ